MNKYARIAIESVKYANEHNVSPAKAWEETAGTVFCNSISNREKACPKEAFLGLCEEGLIEGIPAGSYTKSVKNKGYAVNAVEFLRIYRNPSITELWKASGGEGKTHNAQMNIVVGLCKAGLITVLGPYDERK